MDDVLEQLTDERDCQRLIMRYTHLVDFGQAPDIADLFTADGVWRTDEFAMNGRDEIRAGFQRRQGVARRQSRHVCTNVVVEVDGDTATGLCYLVNYRHDSETGMAERPSPADVPKYVGEYRDRFVRTDEGWRFAERYCEMAFVRPPKHVAGAEPATEAVAGAGGGGALLQATATVQVETEAVRVTRWDFPPGSHTGAHVHQYDYAVVPVTDGRLTITGADGEVVEATLAVGGSYARSAGVEHDVANLGDAAVAFVEIELLDHGLS